MKMNNLIIKTRPFDHTGSDVTFSTSSSTAWPTKRSGCFSAPRNTLGHEPSPRNITHAQNAHCKSERKLKGHYSCDGND
eukprot:3441590-Amphidinium_carterae.1